MSDYVEDVGHPRVNGFPCVCRKCVVGRLAANAQPLHTRDRCTPEERAVIDAATAFRAVMTKHPWIGAHTKDYDERRKALFAAVDNLPAARKLSESTKASS